MDKIKRSLASVAKQNGVSVDEVKREIQKAIDIGMANPDPKIQAFWNSIPRAGERPTPEEVISFFAKEMVNK